MCLHLGWNGCVLSGQSRSHGANTVTQKFLPSLLIRDKRVESSKSVTLAATWSAEKVRLKSFSSPEIQINISIVLLL